MNEIDSLPEINFVNNSLYFRPVVAKLIYYIPFYLTAKAVVIYLQSKISAKCSNHNYEIFIPKWIKLKMMKRPVGKMAFR